jgi:hypothetical protein
MKQLIQKKIMIVVALLWMHFPIAAQSIIDTPPAFLKEDGMNSLDWIPTLLQANSTPLKQFESFNGFVFGWILRGSTNTHNYINGIEFNSPLTGWNSGLANVGLYNSFRSIAAVQNNAYSEEGIGGNGNTQFTETAANTFNKGISIKQGIANTTHIYESSLQWNSGHLKHDWFVHGQLQFQNTPHGLLPNGFKQMRGIVLSAQKKISLQQTIDFGFWWDNISQGKLAPSVLEAYMLSKKRNYNPSWGWYHGNAVYPNTKQSNVPVFALLYKFHLGEKLYGSSSWGIAKGKQQKTSLDWTSSFDPRPDYYRYLPSYIKDSASQSTLRNWLEQQPLLLQVNFDQLEKVNQSNLAHRSFYIINANVSDILALRAAAKVQFQLNNSITSSMGMDFGKDQIRNYDLVTDLLGGDFYYNYNGWVNEDGMPNNFQNDIAHPDRKIKAGEKWGADYLLNNLHYRGWLQFQKRNAHTEWSMGIHFGQSIFNREGLVKNALFPQASLGKSNWLVFPNSGWKAQYLYKISGRLYLRSIVFQQLLSPNSGQVFIAPSTHPFVSPYLLPERHQGVDFSLFYRNVDCKLELHAYWKHIQNQSEQQQFYQDRFHSFVFGVVGQMASVYKGLELSGEATIASAFQISLASTIGSHTIANNPLYDILLVNDLYKVESGILNIKNLPASTSPSIMNALSLHYQPSYLFSFGITGLYAMQRAMNYDYFRRSAWVKSQVTPAIWNQLSAAVCVPDQLVVNAFVSSAMQTKTASRVLRWRSSLSVKNVFNSLIPILSFEQSRFDYLQFDLKKFADKYLFDQGVTFNLSIQLQLQ